MGRMERQYLLLEEDYLEEVKKKKLMNKSRICGKNLDFFTGAGTASAIVNESKIVVHSFLLFAACVEIPSESRSRSS